MTAITAPFATRLESKTARRLLLLIFAVVAVLLYVVFQGQGTLPHDEAYPLFDTLNAFREWIEVNRDSFFLLELIRVGIGGLVAAFEGLLAGLGWPGVIALSGGARAHLRRLAAGAARRRRASRRWGCSGCGSRAWRRWPRCLRPCSSPADRDPARDHRRSQPAVCCGRSGRARRDADHADAGLPRADDAAVRHRRGARDDRDPDLCDPARDPHHVARHPGRSRRRRWRPRNPWAPRAGRRCPRSSCRSPAGPSASGSTRRS